MHQLKLYVNQLTTCVNLTSEFALRQFQQKLFIVELHFGHVAGNKTIIIHNKLLVARDQ